MRARPREYEGGFTLLEMLAYITCLGMVLASVTFVFTTTSRLHAAGSQTMDRVRVTGDIRRVFLRDVREAQNVSSGVSTYMTGPNQLVLELPPPSQASGRRFVVYSMAKRPNRLDRIEFLQKPDTTFEPVQLTTFPLALEAMRVNYSTAQPRQVGIEIDVDRVGTRPIPAGYMRKAPVMYSMRGTLRTFARTPITAGGGMP
ncbi:MAG TPA: hypothetical protein VMZ06_16985 [Candidatus Bathyarchaeia archaeon]|nr:hypothetical protein [Candidatus Bathyarchaeia archaeon]